MRMSFATHYAFDPALDLMVHVQPNGLPPMFACFDFKRAESIPQGRDCVVVVGGRNHAAISEQIAERARRAVVIICPTDKQFDNIGQPLPDNVIRIFTTNRDMSDPRVISFPLGVKSTKLQLLRYARRHRPTPNHRDRSMLYLNFATGDRYDVPAGRRGLPPRKEIASRFRGEDWVTDRVSVGAVQGEGALVKYLADVMKHKFVVSPEGFGIDCYRHWESLYLGAIPIVQRSEHMAEFSDLPIVYTEDYSEITQSYLADVYEQYCSRSFDFSRLYAPCYTSMLVDAVNELDDPAFLVLLSDERSIQARANGDRCFWPAQEYLDRLSRYDSPYPGDLPAGNLIPSNEHDQRQWVAMNGAEVSFGPGGAISVEHIADPGLAGAKLDLPTVRGVSYRVHGEMRSIDEGSPMPRLDVIAAQVSQKVYGRVDATDAATTFDFTFLSTKFGARLLFFPGRAATLSIAVEPVIDA